MVTLIYLLTLSLGLVLAIPFMSTLKEASGMSMDSVKMLKSFDYTAFKELMRFHGEGIRTFISVGFWVSVFYLILSIFLTGGILSKLMHWEKGFSLKSFFSNCGNYFFRFFRLSFYTILMHLVIAMTIYIPMVLIFKGKMDGGASEKNLFYLFIVFAIIHLLLAVYLLVITDYTRFMLVNSDSKKVLKQFWKGVKYVTGKFASTYGLYLMLMVAPWVFIFLYFKVSNLFYVTSGLWVLVLLILQQLFIWLRAGFRVWIFASQAAYFQENPKSGI